MKAATATEVQSHFGQYLKYVMEGNEVMIMKNGKEVARLISRDATVSFLTDELLGVIDHDVDEKAMREERIRKKYECID